MPFSAPFFHFFILLSHCLLFCRWLPRTVTRTDRRTLSTSSPARALTQTGTALPTLSNKYYFLIFKWLKQFKQSDKILKYWYNSWIFFLFFFLKHSVVSVVFYFLTKAKLHKGLIILINSAILYLLYCDLKVMP